MVEVYVCDLTTSLRHAAVARRLIARDRLQRI